MLAPHGIEAVSAGELGLAEPEETGADFIANAADQGAGGGAGRQPAGAGRRFRACAVDALDGAPGIYSARWAGDSKDFAAAMTRIESESRRRPAPRSHFVSALAVVWPDGESRTFEGKVFGDLTFPTRGTPGFGYDPCFTPDGHDRTFGEMSAEEKHGIPADGSQALSHRARAFQMLAAALLQQN